MKIVFYSPQFLPSIGGLQWVVHHWAKELTSLGNEVTVCTHTTADEEKEAVYSIIRNPGIWGEYKLFREADAILLFNVSLKAFPHALLSRKPLFVSHHSGPWRMDGKSNRLQRIKHFIANRIARKQFACSEFIAGQYSNCQTIYSPYNEHVFFNESRERQAGSLLFVGRLVTDKGVDLILKAMKNADNNLHLTVVGSGPEQENLENLAEKLKLTGRVEFVGNLSSMQIATEMNKANTLIIPSRIEPMGIVVAEGLACGIRVIASDTGGIPEVGNEFIEYFESENVDQLSQLLNNQVQKPASTEALSGHLRNFTISKTAEQVSEFLRG